LGALQVPLRAQLHLQVAGPVVTEPCHVPGEAGNEVDALGVGFEVDEELGLLRRDEAGEDPQVPSPG
jgi:hypothetical protein